MDFYLFHRLLPAILLIVAVIFLYAIRRSPETFLFIEAVLKKNKRRSRSYRFYMLMTFIVAVILVGLALFIVIQPNWPWQVSS